MIFHCPKCRSKYKISGHIITEKGINAKCHKCGNIFFVKKKEEMELANVISGIKENIARWEETAKPAETGESALKDEESVNDFINEIEFDFSREKNLPGEERLKELLSEEPLISGDKTVEEEAVEKSPELSHDVIPSELIEADRGGQPVEGETQLSLDVKPDDLPSQDDLNEFLSDLPVGQTDVIQPIPEGEASHITEISEKGIETPVEESTTTPSAPQGGDIDIDLDKLLDDTATELDNKIADTAKKEDSGQLIDAKAEDTSASAGEFSKELEDILLSRSDRPVIEEGVSDETQSEIKEEDHEDITTGLEDELMPKRTGVGKNIKEKWQNYIFLLSSYYSLLLKKTVLWKLAILSVVGIIIIGGVIGLIVIGGKKIISKPKEKKEAAVEAKKPPATEKKAEETVKTTGEEKPAEKTIPLLEQEKKVEEPKPSPSLPVPGQTGFAENSVRLDAILPVAFSPDENKVMSINVRLELENREGADAIKGNLPYYEEIIEDSIDQFFKDKFYEDTHFVKEKLKEVILRKINENIKNGKVKKVDLEELKVK